MPTMEQLDDLIREIEAGNCVAFVGAGFSAPVVPLWKDLLQQLAAAPELAPTTRSRVERLVAQGKAKDLEAAAQILRDQVGGDAFARHLHEIVGTPTLDERMHERIRLLEGIPFRAVLTTNFDGVLRGEGPGRNAYLPVLRPTGHRWYESRWWGNGSGAQVVQLHGSAAAADDLVFTRQDYRRRLYATPGYTTFLRSVMATTTVLYLGFSFTDAYLDEVRSEILALLEYQGSDLPIAYALLHDVDDDEAAYALEHEGIRVISYPWDPEFLGFDDVLRRLHDATNPAMLLGQILAGKRIVWIDPKPAEVDLGMRFLQDAARSAGTPAGIDRFDSARDALDSIAAEGADLVVTQWGHGLGPDGTSVGEHVLGEIRRRDLRTPVMVFASGYCADENRRAALRLGDC